MSQYKYRVKNFLNERGVSQSEFSNTKLMCGSQNINSSLQLF